jgi:hypothetical protein
VDWRAAAVATAEDGRAHVRVGGVVQEGSRVAQPEALIVHLGQAQPVGELDPDGLAAEDEVAHCVVESCGERACGRVLCDGAPADDVEPGKLLDKLVPQRGGVATVEEDATEARSGFSGQVLNEGRRGRQVDPAVRELEGQRAHEGMTGEEQDARVVRPDGRAHVFDGGCGLDRQVLVWQRPHQELEFLAERERA